LRIGRTIAAVAVAALFCISHAGEMPLPAFVFTSAPQFDPAAAKDGPHRFPKGATVILARGTARQPAVPVFYASADPAVSFDGSHILFAGKRTSNSPWQIWEIPAGGGPPRLAVPCQTDCTHPLYVPDGRIVYTQASADGSDVKITEQGGPARRLTFAPGHHVTQDVLRDGRILFASDGELYTVYPDGTGVESLRCDHGPRRSEARQVSSGDVIFSVGGRLARFTSALASQAEVAQPDGEPAGPIAEVEPGKWIVSLRKGKSRFGLYLWTQEGSQSVPLEISAGTDALQPVVLARRVPPKQFPSGLVESRTTGNLLCLDARASRNPIPEEVTTVQVYARSARGAAVSLGRQKLAGDGSFYVEVPADRPLRIELLNAAGRAVRSESGWFWMRPSEQRICVGCHTGPEQAPENKVPEILLRTIVPEKLLGASK
jgi:Hydrazine synthase alpha subunit middle domain